MDKKDKIEVLSKQIEVIHKKLLILLPTGAGSWFYGFKFIDGSNLFLNIIAIILFIIFIVMVIGVFVNYFELRKIHMKLKRLDNGME